MNATDVLVQIGGGAALLLWGVRMVRTGVTRAYGADLRRAMARFAAARSSAFLSGLLVTLLLQSSTATALMLASFAGRGLVAGVPALAAMLGADVGSSLVAQVFALRPYFLAPLLILLGVVVFQASSGSRPRHLARVAIGLGLMILALRLITEASATLRDSEGLAPVLAALADAPAVAMLLGVALAWVAHSGTAVVLLAMSFAATGLLSPVPAIAVVLGANVGSGVTAMMGAVAAEPAGRRVAAGNLLMRFALAVLLLPALQPAAAGLALVTGDGAFLVALAHAAFNVGLACLMLPALDLVHALTLRLFPDRTADTDARKPRHLDPGALDTPAEALAGASLEALRMGDHLQHMLERTIDVFASDDDRLAKQIESDDDVLDALHEAIKLYLTSLARNGLDEAEAARHVEVLSFTTNLEHIGDIIDKNLMELAAKKIRHGLKFSADGFAEIKAFHHLVMHSMRLSMRVFVTGDLAIARSLVGRKVEVRDAERQATERHMARIAQGRVESIESSSLHLDIIRDLKRINAHLTAAAYPILERAGELHPSRLAWQGELHAASREVPAGQLGEGRLSLRGPGS